MWGIKTQGADANTSISFGYNKQFYPSIVCSAPGTEIKYGKKPFRLEYAPYANISAQESAPDKNILYKPLIFFHE